MVSKALSFPTQLVALGAADQHILVLNPELTNGENAANILMYSNYFPDYRHYDRHFDQAALGQLPLPKAH